MLLRPIGHRVLTAFHDEGARQATEGLFGRKLVCVGVIPIRACAALWQLEGIGEALPRFHGVVWVAILLRWHGQAMPMHGGFLFQLIGEVNADFIAFVHHDLWATQHAVVQPKFRFQPFGQLEAVFFRD